MKKIYLSLLSTLFVGTCLAQVPVNNGGFETWASGEPSSWTGIDGTTDTLLTQGFSASVGGNPTAGAVNEITTGSPAGTSHLALTTSTFTDGTDTYLRAGEVNQILSQTTPGNQVTFEFRANIQPNDTAVVTVIGFSASLTSVCQASKQYFNSDNSTSFASETLDLTYLGSGDDLVAYIITISSSKDAPIEGSTFEVDEFAISEATLAGRAQNVVATDISNNGDGTDLQVDFDAAADESTVDQYRIIPISTGSLVDWTTAGIPYKDITPNGSANYTVNFTASDVYLAASGQTLSPVAIVENVEMDVYVISTPAGSATNLNVATSNVIELINNVSLEEKLSSVIFAYPNPATNNISFNFGKANVASVNIMSVNGATVKSVSVNGLSNVNTSISDLAPGIYIYQAVSENGNVLKTDKIIKK